MMQILIKQLQIEILVEIEAGVRRCGFSPKEIISFVKGLVKLPGIKFAVILAYRGLCRGV